MCCTCSCFGYIEKFLIVLSLIHHVVKFLLNERFTFKHVANIDPSVDVIERELVATLDD